MKCSEIHNDLFPYAEGLLSGTKEKAVKEHLAKCDNCRSFYEFLTVSIDHIDTEKQYESDPFLYTRIRAAIEKKENESKPLVLQIITRLSVAAVVLLAIAGGFALGKLYSSSVSDNNILMSEELMFIDELRQETVESFLLTLNEEENE